jgi:hypothetical protein
MSFGQDFMKGFFGSDGLRDSQTAAKTFRTNGYELSPRFKFLFHVSFTLNTTEIPALKSIFGESGTNQIGLTVKTISLPSYEIDHEELNQYNRKRLVQTQIKYQPVNITFHDDGGDITRNLWYNYFAYYYKDPSQQYGSTSNLNGSIGALANMPGFSYNTRDIYTDSRPVNDWGYVGESYTDSSVLGKPAFFKDIRIYGLNQHKFAEYVLINPLITSWQHDTYDYSQGDGMMQNSMTVKYETVKYRSGAISGVRSDTNVKGFGDPANYDTVRSPISRPGSTASVLGQGGLLDTGIGIVEDLQSGTLLGAIGAVQKAGATYNTFKGKSLQSIANEEAIAASKQILQQSLPGAIRSASNVQLFPTPPRTNSTGQGLFNFGGVGVSSSGINIGGFNLPF